MTFVPTFSSACDLALKIPEYISDFLELDRTLRRRFREESVSDLIVACLLNLPYDEMIVMIPDETKTGSDFDIIIANEVTEASIQFRIQAKRLTPHKLKWEMGSYKELAHPHNTGKQASTLVRSSAHEAMPTIPLYAFYNPRSVCEQSAKSISGIELADGRLVNELIKAMVKAKPKRIPNKRIQTLQPLFFPLADILCKPFKNRASDDQEIPPPEVFSRIALETIESRRRNFGKNIDSPMIKTLPIIESIERLTTQDTGDKSKELISDRGSMLEKPRLPIVIKEAIAKRKTQKVIRTRTPRPRFILVSGSFS